jgi:hypothetical protein
MLKALAHTRRVCRANGWPTAEDCAGMVDSGGEPGPEYPDEYKTQFAKVWPQLSLEDQEVLAPWRKKHLAQPPSRLLFCRVTVREIRPPPFRQGRMTT